MVVRREERIARLALGSTDHTGRLKSGADAPQLIEVLPLDAIDPDPDQPRRHFDQDALQELADSLASVGQLQPVIVIRAGERYRLHVGERRWRASQLAGLTTIRALVRSTPLEARDARIAQIVENEQRAALTTTELVGAVRDLQADGLKNVEIASALSRNPTRISELLALAEAPPPLAAIIDAIGASLAYQLLRQWRTHPQAALDFLAHMPAEHITRVTIATIGDAEPDAEPYTLAPPPEAAATGKPPTKNVTPGTDEGLLKGEGASPRIPAAANGNNRLPAMGAADVALSSSASIHPIVGGLLVEHDEHGRGLLLFDPEVPVDHLSVGFTGGLVSVVHKDAVRILRAIPRPA